ncbi:MAG: UDP-N-acetylmuramate dehydrogenase [Rhodothermales bacterium]|nr:UDP-N-acetylmuramate dehydrogenase [Rhodothermales bacterium]
MASHEQHLALAKRLESELGAGRVFRRVQLAPYTTFKIGGPADLFVEARSADELATILGITYADAFPHFVLGLGANILVGDGGFRGLVIRNCAKNIVIRPDGLVTAESGAIVYPDLIERCVDAGLSGLEHYVGIPSTVGGALWQNLHFLSPAPERERTMFIAEVVRSADILERDGTRHKVDRAYFKFGYDYSILHDNGAIVLQATFELAAGNELRLRRIMQENLEWRSSRHPPLDLEPSAGSIFKKIDGVGAGRLIDRAGLKGTRVGGAEVTHRHANILINRDHATAADVRKLIAYIQAVVLDKSGYRLEPEISFVGDFDNQ